MDRDNKKLEHYQMTETGQDPGLGPTAEWIPTEINWDVTDVANIIILPKNAQIP